jgi:hypothetical protein
VDILKGRLVWNIVFPLGCAIIFWLHVMLRRSSGIKRGSDHHPIFGMSF